MTAMIGEAKMHDEPYTSGMKEGDGEYYTLEDFITISMHVLWCMCGY